MKRLVGWTMSAVRRLAGTSAALAEPRPADLSYAAWIEQADRQAPATRPVPAWQPRVRIDVSGSAPSAVARTLESLRSQSFESWHLFDAGGHWLASGQAPAVPPAPDAADISLQLRAGDRLASDALWHVVHGFSVHPHTFAFTADDDVWPDAGARTEPRFLPPFDVELARAGLWCGGFLAFREAGQPAGPRGASPFERLLHLVETRGEQAVRHLPHVLYHHAASPRPPGPPEWDAVERHLARVHPGASLVRDPDTRPAHVRYPLPTPLPSVTLVMPTRNQPSRLATAVESILRSTDYPAFDIVIIDNGSDSPAALAALRTLAGHPRVRVRRDDRAFNWSALNNAAAAEARGDLLCFVNDDVEANQSQWLGELVRLAVRPDVGVAGARLWYPNGTLQHAGLVLNPEAGASHVFQRLPASDRGYLGLAATTRRVSAVTGACLVVRRDVFARVGGFDEELASDFNDVDFCLRVSDAGLKTLWTPHANLVHHEGATRGNWDDAAHRRRFEAARQVFLGRWGDRVVHDPCLNPNVRVSREQLSLASPPIPESS